MDELSLLKQLRKSPKYAAIDEGTLLRVIGMMMPRYKKEKEVLDAAKRHLHVISGMYQDAPELARAAAILGQAAATPATPLSIRQTGLALMGEHASTRERLPDPAFFYRQALQDLPPPGRLLDLGCGFQPFARPFMPLPPETYYAAYDLLPQGAALIDTFFAWAGLPGEAGVLDLLLHPPAGQYDLALLMKLLPVLEQQRKGAAADLLKALPAQYALVTFPTRSMGGGRGGLSLPWADWMEHRLPDRWRVLRQHSIGQELLYVLICKEEPS